MSPHCASRLRACLVLAALLPHVGCDRGPEGISATASPGPMVTPEPAAAAAASATGGAADAGQVRLAALRRAELTRRAADVLPADQSSRQVPVRRAAARALARVGGATAREGLLRALADEDEEVVAWAAHGLGRECAGKRDETVSALVAALATRAGAAAERPAALAAALSARRAIVRAVGRCGGAFAEPALVSWLGHPLLRRDAVYALGDLGAQQGKLREESLVTLLELGSGNATSPPEPVALCPLGRVSYLPPSVVGRAREVAEARLAAAGADRVHAVHALGRTDSSAVAALSRVAGQAGAYSAAERVAAVRALSRLGPDGQRAMLALLGAVAPQPGTAKAGLDPLQATALVGEGFAVPMAVLGALDRVGAAGRVLQSIARLLPPPEAPAAVLRRLSLLRCAAASLLAERDWEAAILQGCDLTGQPGPGAGAKPAPGAIGARAIVAAIGTAGVKIRGKRLQAWRAFATSGELGARESALALVAEHPEIPDAAAVLAAALRAPEPGLVASAAEVIRRQPQRARAPSQPRADQGEPAAGSATAGPVQAPIAAALLDALAGKGACAETRALVAVVDAVAALTLDPARTRLEELCRSPLALVREHAARALTTMLGGSEIVQCPPPPEGAPAPAELGHLLGTRVVLRLDTDAGELGLRLDPTLAPVAVTRLVDLARAGFFRAMAVHRVVPGFVAELGSRTGDGYGSPELGPIPSESAPVPFAALAVGAALSGRDTGSGQIFVTLGDEPHLDGEYAWLGEASGPWAALVEGDVIREVKVISGD